MRLTHGRNEIELHELRQREGTPLLLLHELGGSSAASWAAEQFEAWCGPVYALDFSGHGSSEHVAGSAYSPEYFLADADISLLAISTDAPCAVIGAGIGAYVAMMLAAARAEQVPAALLLSGRGLSGGGLLPKFKDREITNLEEWEARTHRHTETYLPETDPGVAECEHDIRPEGYVDEFANGARCLLLSESVGRDADVPPWWHFATGAPGSQIVSSDFANALLELGDVCLKENAA